MLLLALASVVWATPPKPSAPKTSAPKAKAQQTIVIIGSSTAAGVGASPLSECWASRYAAYVAENAPSVRVVNLAVGGYTTYQLLPSASKPTPHRPLVDKERNITAALAMQPAAIIINLGGNDEMDNFTESETIANYEAIIAAAFLQHVPVWVTTPKPVQRSAEQRRQMLRVRDWTLRRFRDFAIDFWSGLAAPDGSLLSAYNSGDGIHANNAGHALLFDRVVAAGILERILKNEDDHPAEEERRR